MSPQSTGAVGPGPGRPPRKGAPGRPARRLRAAAWATLAALALSVLVPGGAGADIAAAAAAGPTLTAAGPALTAASAADSDGDGLPDAVEARGLDTDRDGLVSELDRDSDGDGLVDGLEDRDHDGAVDAGETDPQAADSDYDGLADGEEDSDLDGVRDPGETHPTNFDSDGDGVPDGWESLPFCDADGDGLVNALDRDCDGDGLSDLDEAAWGADPLNPDTDGDGLSDGQEAQASTSPQRPDSDGDGLSDIQEAPSGYAPPGQPRASYWAKAAAPGPKAVYDGPAGTPWVAGPDESGLILSSEPFPTLEPGSYRLYVRARCANSPSGAPSLTLRITGPPQPLQVTHPLPWVATRAVLAPPIPATPPPVKPANPPSPAAPALPNPYRWYCTPPLDLPGGGKIGVTALCAPGEDVRLDRLLLVRAEDAFTPVTDPLNPDTDGDGVRDGDEGPAPSWWWEAEAFPPDAAGFSRAVPDAWASNGLLAAPGPDGALCRITGLSELPAGSYCLLLRGRPASPEASGARVRVSVSVRPGAAAAERLVEGAAELEGGCRQGRWVLAEFGSPTGTPGGVPTLNLELDAPARLSVVVSAEAATAGPEAARAASLTGDAEAGSTAAASAPLLDEVALVRARLDPARSGRRLPYRATNSLDPDTDGDRVRPHLPGPLAGVAVYLTDGQEIALGTHPLDCDTDGDREGAAPAGMGPQDAAPGTDALDPDPWARAGEPASPWNDTDRDGLPDGMEDRDRDGRFSPELGETDPNNRDTDRDGLPDAVEDWDGDGVWENGETNPLDPDTDGDALLDGTYMPVGAERLVYEPGRPDQRAAFESVLARLEPPADPRPGAPPVRVDVDRDPGQVAFIGEGDINIRGRYRAWYSTSGLWQPARPLGVDSDQDGLPDGLEALGLGTNPLSPDSDHDLLPDPLEVLGTGTDPTVADRPDLAVDPASLDCSPQPALAGPGGSWLELFATVRNAGPLDAPGLHRVQFYLTAQAGPEGEAANAGGAPAGAPATGQAVAGAAPPAPQQCAVVRLPAIEAGGARRVHARVLMLPAQELEALSAAGSRPPCFAVAPGRYRLEVALSTPLDQGGRTQNDRASTELVVGADPAGAPAQPPVPAGEPQQPAIPPAAGAGPDTAAVPPALDADGDGLTDADEVALGTDPGRRDSDGDLAWDGEDLDPLDGFEVKVATQQGPGGWSRLFGPGFLRLEMVAEAYGLEGRVLDGDEAVGRQGAGAASRAALSSSPRSHQAAQTALCLPGLGLESCDFVGSRLGPGFTPPGAGAGVQYRSWVRQYRAEAVNLEPMGCGGFWSAVAPVGVARGRDQELWLQFTIDPAWDRTRPPQEAAAAPGPPGPYRLPGLYWRVFAEGAVQSVPGVGAVSLAATGAASPPGAGPTLLATQAPVASGLALAARPPGGSACLARVPIPSRAARGLGPTGTVWLEIVPVWLASDMPPAQPGPGMSGLDPGDWTPGAGPRLEPLDPRALRFSAATRCIILEERPDGGRVELRMDASSLEDLAAAPPLREALALTGSEAPAPPAAPLPAAAPPAAARTARLSLPAPAAGGHGARPLTVLARACSGMGRPGGAASFELLEFTVQDPRDGPPGAGQDLDPSAAGALGAALAAHGTAAPDQDGWPQALAREEAAAALLGRWPAWGPALLSIAERAAGRPPGAAGAPAPPPLFTYRRLAPQNRLQPVYGCDWLWPAPAAGARAQRLWTAQVEAWAGAFKLVNALLARGQPACLVLPPHGAAAPRPPVFTRPSALCHIPVTTWGYIE